MNSPDKFVRIYNFETETSTTIPADELAPGMVEAKIQGKEGTYWIDPNEPGDMAAGPFQHPPFDEERRAQIQEIMDALKEVKPMTFKNWEEGFRRDRHPDQEIGIWLFSAAIYSDMVQKHELKSSARKDLFRVLLSCQTSSYDHVRQVIEKSELPETLVQAAVETFYRHPTLKKEFALLNPEDFADTNGNIPNPVTVLESAEGREALQRADIIYGIDCFTRNRTIFFGRERLKMNLAKDLAECLETISFLYDSRTDQLEFLVAAVQVQKGSCCYGEK